MSNLFAISSPICNTSYKFLLFTLSFTPGQSGFFKLSCTYIHKQMQFSCQWKAILALQLYTITL